ncbi:MAG TPA: amidohydrolase family protein [Bryobacteraceae bacterium]|nr:amidohydrolase family protein [Bryobacteraceae bacterium]
MIFDYHHHFLPFAIAERKGFRAGQKGNLTEGGIPKLTVHPRLYDLEAQLREMDQVGIDVSVLSCNLGWDGTLADCREINEAGAELQRKYPTRFAALAHAPVLEAEGLAEIERSVKELGLRGATIASQVNGLCLDAAELRPFYKRMCDLDLAVFIHPAMLPQGYSMFREYDLARIIGREMDLQIQVARVIAGRVMEEFPSLKLVFSHFGGGIAAVKERLMGKAGRFGTLTRPFEESFDRLYFDTAGFEGGPVALRCAVQGIRPDRLVFATDYPQDFTGATSQSGKTVLHIRDYIDEIRRLDLPQGAADAILGETAAGLLHIDAATFLRTAPAPVGA